MKRTNNKRKKSVRNLVLISALTAIVLTVSTYAWFIGMKTVNVTSFEVEIATTEGLYLSMNGTDWSYTLNAKTATAYTGNTNNWATDGLIPVSTVGDMDSSASRMKLYEKGSLTTTPGGYRLLTSRVHNHDNDADGNLKQGKGYVVFDLFIKNLSGTEYYPINQPLNEEAVYLTTNSAVTVASDGEANTGIENSVRVAFAQIGRVKADTETASVITGITCTSNDSVTGVCRNAQIWEPNDKKHVANAISWYDTSCKQRLTTGEDVTLAASFSTADKCTAVTDSVAKPTYAISRALGVDDNVDIYDGLSYNTYKANTIDYATYNAATGETKEAYKLVDFPYFTDTMKNETGTARTKFMTLAPNSITKVRVYVFIEGQDVDNYDFASLGKKISINFGFTKERYIESDIGYSGPSTDITNQVTNNNTDNNTE